MDKIKGIIRTTRVQGQHVINDLAAKIRSIRENNELSNKEQDRMTKAALEKLGPHVNERVNTLVEYPGAIMISAEANLKEAREIDPEKAKVRAAILGPQLAAMTNEQLFEFYKARASDKVDRRISEEILLARFDTNTGKNRSVELGSIESQYNRIQPQIRQQLTLRERDALNEFELATELSGYAERSAKFLDLQLAKLQRPLKQEEKISLARCSKDIERFDNDFSEPESGLALNMGKEEAV